MMHRHNASIAFFFLSVLFVLTTERSVLACDDCHNKDSKADLSDAPKSLTITRAHWADTDTAPWPAWMSDAKFRPFFEQLAERHPDSRLLAVYIEGLGAGHKALYPYIDASDGRFLLETRDEEAIEASFLKHASIGGETILIAFLLAPSESVKRMKAGVAYRLTARNERGERRWAVQDDVTVAKPDDPRHPLAAPEVSIEQEAEAAGVLLVRADPDAGFRFPFFLYTPDLPDPDAARYLLVEPNNTGAVSDDLDVHLKKALSLTAHSHATRLAKRLQTPLLVPGFPRPRSQWRAYTHSLDRDTLKITEGPMRRIDRQLIAMIRRAQHLLRDKGLRVHERVWMHGYSASGNFSNRFAYLHPEVVRAVASGGVNGIPVVPVGELNGHELPFPIGIADIEQLTGKPFDDGAYRTVSQFIYMGYLDRNDTVPSRDAWDEREAELIKKAVAAEMMPDRWRVSQRIYEERELPVQTVTYNGVGHSITPEMLEDIARFFEANSAEGFTAIEPHEYPFVEHRQIRTAHINRIYWSDDPELPGWLRYQAAGEVSLLIGIDEWIRGQDHRQLDEFYRNAGFAFALRAEGQPDVQIGRRHYYGNCSSGDGTFQAYCVRLSDTEIKNIAPDVGYRLVPLTRNDDYEWKSPAGVELVRN